MQQILYCTTVTTDIQSSFPSPVLCLNRSTTNTQFHTLVIYVTSIYLTKNITCCIRQTRRHNLVIRIVSIICEVKSQTIVKETHFQTQFGRFCNFRLQCRVTRLPVVTYTRQTTQKFLTRPQRCFQIIRTCILTYASPATTKLTERQPFRQFIKQFSKYKRSTYRRIEV